LYIFQLPAMNGMRMGILSGMYQQKLMRAARWLAREPPVATTTQPLER
jgi:hypothetical protein